MTISQEKLAQLQQDIYNDISIPAFVQRYNEKAASVGAEPICTEDDLAGALQLVEFIEEKRAAEGSSFQKLATELTGAPAPTSDDHASLVGSLALRIKEMDNAD